MRSLKLPLALFWEHCIVEYLLGSLISCFWTPMVDSCCFDILTPRMMMVPACALCTSKLSLSCTKSTAYNTYINHIWILKPLDYAYFNLMKEELSDGLSISVLHREDQNHGRSFQVWVLISLTLICPYPFVNWAKLSYAEAHTPYSNSHLARISQPQHYW